MMRLPPFAYLAPGTAAEAAALLAEHGPAAALVAGGTDLYPNMKRRQVEPAVLVSLGRVAELRGIRENGGVSVGATTTLREIAAHPGIRGRYPAFARAAELVSSPQIRNVATVGGNLCVDTRCNYLNMPFGWRKAIDFCLKAAGETCWVAPGGKRCWAISSSDVAPAAVALGARVRLVSAGSERVVPAAELYRNDGIDYLGKRPDELLAEVLLPPADGWRSTYLKLRRRGTIDFPILGVAAAVRLEDGVCAEARIVLGAVASAPLEAVEAGRALAGSLLSEEAIEAAAEAAAGPARPLDNTDLTHSYRKRMVRVYVARALRELAAQSG